MKHYRRKKLLNALRDMYLNNWKDSASYAEQQMTIRCLESVGSKLREQFEKETGKNPDLQLDLFGRSYGHVGDMTKF